MNLKINTLIKFDGSQEELENLVADFGRVLVEWNLANVEDGEAQSIICVNTIEFDDEDDVSDWLQEQADEGAYLVLPIADMRINVVNPDGSETEI